MQQKLREEGGASEAARRDEMKKAVFEELVSEALLEDRAKDLDIVTSDAEVEEQIRRLKEQNSVKNDEEFNEGLAASGLTIDRLREQLRRTLTVQRVVGREVNSKVDLSDDTLRAIYEREKETWRIPEQVHVAEILIARGDDALSRGAAEIRAKDASEKLKAGAKFEDVVKEYSEGPTRSRGGDLGNVSKGDLASDIDRVAFSLPVGAVSDPIATKNGWHIVKVLGKTPVTYKPFSEVKADLLKREQDTQFQKKLAEYLEKLKKEAVIRVSEDTQAYYQAPVYAVPAPPPPEAKGSKKSKKG